MIHDFKHGLTDAEYAALPSITEVHKQFPASVLGPLSKEFGRARDIQADILGFEGTVSLHHDTTVGMLFRDYHRLIRGLRYERQEIGRLRSQLQDIQRLAHRMDDGSPAHADLLESIDVVAGQQPYPKDI